MHDERAAEGCEYKERGNVEVTCRVGIVDGRHIQMCSWMA